MNTGCLRCGRLPGNSHTEICALQGEIERLRHDIKRHIAIASELATENEGLRDELARKAEGYTRLAEVHEGAMKMWESDERECAMKAYEMAAELKGLREEVERLRAELAEATQAAEAMELALSVAGQEFACQLAEAKRDAERYRWLTLTSDTNPLMVYEVASGRLLFGYEADVEIDIHRYGGR